MEHALDNVVALGWEVYEDEEVDTTRMVFQFGEDLKSVSDKLYARDLVLDYDKTVSYVK